MKGLIAKDFLNLKRYSFTLILILLLYGAIFLPMENGGFAAVATVLCTMMVITTLSYDEMAKWDKYVLTMSITRQQLVLGKYAVMLILAALGCLVGCVAIGIQGIIRGQWDPGALFMQAGLFCSASLVLGSILLPLLYKFGAEKGRLLLLAVVLIPTVLSLGWRYIGEALGLPAPDLAALGRWFQIALPLLPLAVLAIVALSYALSVRIMSKKEF